MRNLMLLGAMALALSTAASGTTYLVCPDGTGDFLTIQPAIDAAVNGDIIELCDATFTGDGNRDLDYGGKAITVRSRSGNPQACVIDCQGSPANPHRAFYFHSGEGNGSVLAAIKIMNGFHFAPGGGIHCDGASPTITDCVLSDNLSFEHGAGMFCTNCSPVLTGCTFSANGDGTGNAGAGLACLVASPTLTDCTFSGNSSQAAGGLYCGDSSSPSLTNCVFSENTATAVNGYGGGMLCYYSSSPTITDCAFSDNSGDSGGGAAFYDNCSPSLDNCCFMDNSSGNGGGVYWLYLCLPTLVDCTFWNNTAIHYGGAMWCSASSPALTNCTLSANSAGLDGGGVHCYQSSPTFDNTIIAFSTSGAAVYCYDAGSTPVLSCCDVYGNAGGDWVGCIAGQAAVSGNIALDPLFCDAASGDFRLEEDSPCAPFSPPNPNCDLIGAWPVGCGPSPVIEEAVSHSFLSLDSSPNPFGLSTRIWYVIPSRAGACRVQLSIYDAAGRLVRILVDARQPSGAYDVLWDGTDHTGKPVGTGIYYSQLNVGAEQATKRLVLVR